MSRSMRSSRKSRIIANRPVSAASETGAICERQRKAEEGSAGYSDERRRVDEDDTLLLEHHMPCLKTFDRLLLWWCYIDQPGPRCVSQAVDTEASSHGVCQIVSSRAGSDRMLSRQQQSRD
jgi:hypothetical protein